MSYILGLTGAIAMGKSIVSSYFKDLGFPVVDLDEGTRIVEEPGQDGLVAIEKTFGSDYILADGQLDRQKLGQLIFNDEQARQSLMKILSKPLRRWMDQEIGRYQRQGHSLIVVDMPLLFEKGFEKECDGVMVVYVPKEIQVERLMKRDQIDRETALVKISSQLDGDEQKSRADFVIDNSQTIENTLHQVDDWLNAKGFKPLEQSDDGSASLCYNEQ